MRTLKIVLLTVFVFSLVPIVGSTSGPTLANDNDIREDKPAEGTEGESSSDVDWTPVMEAIILVESEGNPRAVNGNQVGAMQITPICVKECNLILKERKMKKRYTLNDRFSVKKSKEMFLLIQSHRNPENSVEVAIRAWNGGPRYSKRATQRYYERVMRRMK